MSSTTIAVAGFPQLDLDYMDKQAKIEELKAKLAFQKSQGTAAKTLARSGVDFLISSEEMAAAGAPRLSDMVCGACASSGQYGWCKDKSPEFPCPRR